MLRMTFLLCSSLFLVMLLGGRDFGQLRPGLAQAQLEAKAAPVTAAAPVVETVALAPEAVLTPIAPVAVLAAPVVIAEVAPAPVPVLAEPDNTVFTLSNYADPVPAAGVQAAPEQAAPEQAAEGEIWYVAGNSLNVRAGPSTDDAIVGKLLRGEAMLMVARDGGDWARIRIEGDGMEGYVATRFLSAELPVIN